MEEVPYKIEGHRVESGMMEDAGRLRQTSFPMSNCLHQHCGGVGKICV